MKLTTDEETERLQLLDYQKDLQKVMSPREFDRLKYLQAKLYRSIDKDNRTYDLEVSPDGKNWNHVTQFIHGQQSRFEGTPLDEVIAVREAEGYRETTAFSHVRLIISI